MPVLGLPTYFVYAMRPICCRCSGRVEVERVPWTKGKRQSTEAFCWFLASVAGRLSWNDAATLFRAACGRVYRALEMAVLRGRALDDVAMIGDDDTRSSGRDAIADERLCVRWLPAAAVGGQGESEKALRAALAAQPSRDKCLLGGPPLLWMSKPFDHHLALAIKTTSCQACGNWEHYVAGTV